MIVSFSNLSQTILNSPELLSHSEDRLISSFGLKHCKFKKKKKKSTPIFKYK